MATNISYDPNVIHEFSDRLYTKANSIIRNYTIVGIIILGFAGLSTQEPIIGGIGAIIGGLLGYILGKEKAFQYKLQAQIALCQVQIEANSRP